MVIYVGWDISKTKRSKVILCPIKSTWRWKSFVGSFLRSFDSSFNVLWNGTMDDKKNPLVLKKLVYSPYPLIKSKGIKRPAKWVLFRVYFEENLKTAWLFGWYDDIKLLIENIKNSDFFPLKYPWFVIFSLLSQQKHNWLVCYVVHMWMEWD